MYMFDVVNFEKWIVFIKMYGQINLIIFLFTCVYMYFALEWISSSKKVSGRNK